MCVKCMKGAPKSIDVIKCIGNSLKGLLSNQITLCCHFHLFPFPFSFWMILCDMRMCVCVRVKYAHQFHFHHQRYINMLCPFIDSKVLVARECEDMRIGKFVCCAIRTNRIVNSFNRYNRTIEMGM